MKDGHVAYIARDGTEESTRGQTFERTGLDPMNLAPVPATAPSAYHRTINIAWWMVAFAAGVVVWAALLD